MDEYLDFIKNLEPVWEDPHEFDWLRSEEVETEEKRLNPIELNRFPGLKLAMGY